MRTQRQQPATRVLLALAVLLGSLWVGGLAAQATDAADRLAAFHTQPGFEPAVLGDRGPALRPPVDRPDPGGRLLPAPVGMLVAALVAARGSRAGRSQPGLVRARSLAGSTRLEPRAPPSLQTA
jgi:hypothetical protein